jgi:hypothetical protein
MIAILFLVLFPEGATDVNFLKIKLGMSREQVVKIIRQQPVARPTDADRSSSLGGFTLSSARIRKDGELWRTGKTKLWLVFDKDQRVTGMMLEHGEPGARPILPGVDPKLIEDAFRAIQQGSPSSISGGVGPRKKKGVPNLCRHRNGPAESD